MDKLIYTAMTGASHVLQQQAAVSENLANVNTTGFRAMLSTFSAVPLVGEGLPTRTFVVDSTTGSDFTPAAIQQTGNPLDVAVKGAGWIAIQDANGKEAYTRNGNFQISPNGVMQTYSGLSVLSNTGPIVIPPDTEVTIAKDGTISTVPSGTDPAAVVVVGQLKLVNPPSDQLDRGGDGLFRMKNGSAALADVNAEVVPGSLEGSNANPVEAMVDMISLARKFDMQMKMLLSADTDAQHATSVITLAS